MKIISPSNPKIKRIAKLKHRKMRDQTGLTLVDGLREVSRAHDAGLCFEEFYLCSELLELFAGKKAIDHVLSWGINVCEVSRPMFDKISYGDRKEGVAAVIQTVKFGLETDGLPKEPLVVVLEDVEKPGNLGAILRSCDGAGVDAVIVADNKTDIFNPNVIRASTGIVFSMRIMQAAPLQVKDFLRSNNMKIAAAAPGGEQTYFSLDFKGALAVVLGAEDKGLSDFWLDAADFHISIPMHGKADSLNVSNTAAILVYEALRQRRQNS